MADQQNPFTMMGMMQMMQPNKYVNPAYANQPLPIPGFRGPATDAMGNTIQSFADAQAAHDAWQPPAAAPAAAPAQGTTLNSAPQDFGMYGAPSASELATRFPGPNATPQQQAQAAQANAAMQARINPGPSAYYAQGNSNSLGGNQYDSARIPLTPFAQAPTGPQQGPQQQAPAAAAPTNPIDMRQAYLDALANPGNPAMPGATVPQAQPLGQPSVLDAFLSTHQGGGTPAPAGGGYGNAGFFNTLNKLRSN